MSLARMRKPIKHSLYVVTDVCNVQPPSTSPARAVILAEHWPLDAFVMSDSGSFRFKSVRVLMSQPACRHAGIE